ncbi:BRCT domain-containing protein [Phycisphaera mikurensis]|uniref:Uncharacterized protein n=1 Tax=Phycisphaera mikurensis (strain NBRC 102666 / KCTC 22515 / FYK2301M01) TaxID=1142394 RepID=I0IEE9_PHYMF|nr:BRCT domain-containing protein [Phycisphaera mikurensis]MBB6441437.1 putative nucleic acid-binding Zn-ribbon protein [Phycisphaera mikurensis]BAM03637.1 hypothetical protein PSMK_14780 [Phycisphaera mikurensis NBRC 102666]
MARARTGGNSSAAWAITALAAGFGVCGILAIVLYARAGGVQEELAAAQNDLGAYVSPGETQLPAIAEARTAAQQNRTSVVGELLERLRAAEQEAARTNDDLRAARTELEGFKTRFAEQESRAEQANQRAEAAAAETASLRATYDQQAAGLKADVDRAAEVNEQLRSDLADMRQSLTGTMGEARNDLQGRIDQLQIELSAAQRELDDAVAALDQATQRQAERIARVAVPDGRVVSVVDNGSAAYLNIGSNQRVQLGMTFGVYNPSSLVKLEVEEGGAEDVPPKAVVEVFELAPGTATVRVVERQPNARVSVGDPLVNIAFDPQRDLKFFAFGDFDVDGDGNATEVERQRIRSMIERYGAEVAEGLDFDVDYLVLGEPPQLPRELVGSEKTNPVRIKEYNQALQTYNSLTDLLAQAERYTIPVLNQNRFLDLIGYYTR